MLSSRWWLSLLMLLPPLSVVSSARVFSADAMSQSDDAGLYLFLNEEQQMREEEMLRSDNGDDISIPVLADTEELNADKDSVNNEQSGVEEDVSKQFPEFDRKSNRYNGVVMKGTKVLDVWVDGQRFSISEQSHYLNIENVNRNGVIRLSGLGGIVELAPGDPVPDNSGKDSAATLLETTDDGVSR